MQPERRQNCIEIFQAASERPPDERSAFVETECAGDEVLRRRVELLLKYHEQSGDFMETPAYRITPELLLEDADALIGEHLGPFRVDAVLGVGGMGVVYLAFDERLGRKVGLKLLPRSLVADEAQLARLKREARTASALNHPNIVIIHEIGEIDSTHYIATEFVEGTTLRERMARGPVPLEEALEIALQIASAISVAHEAGIVHRDVKPENVMLRPDGLVKVLDFGLAKLALAAGAEPLNESMLKTNPGVVMGTAAYMSPEQARGLEVDARTDVWSAGVVLYEMVAGRRPFTGATPTDVIIAIAERDLIPLASPEAPTQLEQIVKKALAKNREERYQTAKDLLIDLKDLKRRLDKGSEAGRSEEAIATSKPAVKRSRVRTLAALVVVLVVAGVASSSFLRRSSPPAQASEIKALAVLPLENLSGDASQDYFADGMTEALITDLAKVGALRVISRASVAQYKSARKPLPQVGRELNVDAVLTGSVVRSGERARIAVQLTHAATDRNLWSESYERDLRDVLTLQREITRDIVGGIRGKLTPQEQVRLGNARPVNPEAYDHYLRGKFYLHRQTREENNAAITALERAVASDPSFAAAHAELAQAYVWKLFLFAPDERLWAEKAFIETEKALALDPNLGVAHLARGRLLWTPANRFPHEQVIHEYRRALALDPSLDEARHQLALVYSHVGLLDESLEELRAAVAGNPTNSVAQYRIGETLLLSGRYDEALPALRAVPREANPALIGHQIPLALLHLGRKEEAAATLEQFTRDYPQDNHGLFTSVQAILAALDGQEQIAEEKIASAIKEGKGFGHFHHTAYHIACAYALMHKPEQAMRWLEAAAEDGFPCYPFYERDANLDNLRHDARFIALLAKLRQQRDHYRSIL